VASGSSGTGGKNHTPLGAPIANSEVQNDRTFGVLELTLRPDGYDWKFIPETGKTFTDSGSGTCHPASGTQATRLPGQTSRL
jgi:acid phosphatase type 7